MSPFHPTGGYDTRHKCVDGKHHNWKFAFSGKAVQISECTKCGEYKWKYKTGSTGDNKQANDDILEYITEVRSGKTYEN